MIHSLLRLSVVTLLFASSSAFAAGISRFVCKTQQPCQHSAAQNLGVCVGEVELLSHSDGTGLIVVRTQRPQSNITNSTSYQVLFNRNAANITCQDGTGDNWVKINAVNNGYYRGTITLEQDFSFAVDCRQDISVPFRK